MVFWIIIGFCTFLGVVYCWIESRIYYMNYKTRTLSGYPTKPIVGNILDFKLGGNPQDKLRIALKALAENSSPFRYIGGPFWYLIVVDDADNFRDILKNRNIFIKGRIYSMMATFLKRGLITSEGERWETHRRLLNPSFHIKILEQYFETFLIRSDLFVSKLPKEKTTMDISPSATRLTFEIITETAMGITHDDRKQDNDAYFKNIERIQKIFCERISKPWLWTDFTFKLTKLYRKGLEAVEYVENIAKEVIEKRRNIYEKNKNREQNVPKSKLVFLDLCFEIQKKNPASFDDNDILEEANIFIFAGHETTASSISFCIYSLAKNPEIQQNLFEEISSIMESSPGGRLTLKELNQMSYLDRVVKETLRMYPSAPFMSRTANQDFTLTGGKCIPKNADIILMIYGLHHNKKYWTEPYKFDPDRFLPEATESRHPYAYLPFSAEARKCIGYKYAMMEIKVVICQLVRNFSLIDVGHEPDLVFEITLSSNNGIIVELEPRKQA